MKELWKKATVRQNFLVVFAIAVAIAAGSALTFKAYESGMTEAPFLEGSGDAVLEYLEELPLTALVIEPSEEVVAESPDEFVVVVTEVEPQVTYEMVLETFYKYPTDVTSDELQHVIDTYHAQRVQRLSDEAALAEAERKALPIWKRLFNRKGDSSDGNVQ